MLPLIHRLHARHRSSTCTVIPARPPQRGTFLPPSLCSHTPSPRFSFSTTTRSTVLRERGGCFAAATRPVTGSSTHPHLLRHVMPCAPQLSSAGLAVENKPGASWGFPSISSCFGSVSQHRKKKKEKRKRGRLPCFLELLPQAPSPAVLFRGHALCLQPSPP